MVATTSVRLLGERRQLRRGLAAARDEALAAGLTRSDILAAAR